MSSILPYALWRGCASSFPLPIDRDHMRQANELRETLSQNNPGIEIEYRSRGHDILHHVLRWNNTPYEQVFKNGFRAGPQDGTPNNVYFSLEHHVLRGRTPGSPNRRIPHVFVSTTLNPAYHPPINDDSTIIYLYEIYAPGGIWVAQTLGHRYPCDRQDEVAFVAGIAPQYIRSAQRFRAIYYPTQRRRIWEPADNRLIINTRFNPQPSSYVNIQNPLSYRIVNGERVDLTIIEHPPPPPQEQQEDRQVSTSSSTIQHWYAEDAANIETYINAAFRSSFTNEAHLFIKNEYVLLNYAPGTTNDKVIYGPVLIRDTFPSLRGTAFGEYGIDCAFGSHDRNQAFIFSGNLCACIGYGPHTSIDKIIKGPMTISKMFPFLKGTVLESGVDAAFESSIRHEACLFKDNYYAHINYSSDDAHLMDTIHLITEGFPHLKGTIFESGFDAAFASHITDEAYIFKGDSYARIDFSPGTTNDKIIGSIQQILPYWPSLHGILPRENRGLAVHDHTTAPDSDDDHDEL